MNNSMISSSVSMSALQKKLDLIADNMANLNTVGYKRKTSVFEDLLTSLQPHQEEFRQPGRATPLGYTQGWGVRLSTIMLDMSQGNLKSTGNPTDIAIEGNALFEITMPDGTSAYTRHGAFQMVSLPNGDRQLVTDSGMPVVAQDGGDIIVPAGYNLTVHADGTMMAVGRTEEPPIALGSIRLVQVLKPELLRSVGHNMYGIAEGVNANDVVEMMAVLPQGTAVRQGFTEDSNVVLADEMAELLTVQRAYQLNARALVSSEQMLNMANHLRG